MGAVALCGCNGSDSADVLASATIGPDGGVLAGGGYTLTIPARALTREVEVSLRKSGRTLTVGDWTQAGDAIEILPAEEELRLPARLDVDPKGNAADAPAILYEQDRLTVAREGRTVWIHEFTAAASATAGTSLVDLVEPQALGTEFGGSAPGFRDLSAMQVSVSQVSALQLVFTAYDTADAYVEALNGDRDGDCAFAVQVTAGGSLRSRCDGTPVSAVVGVSGPTVSFDLVPSEQAPKMPTPVTVAMVAGGADDLDEPAHFLGYFTFDTSPCFRESCGGRGTCSENGGQPTCSCEDGWTADGLDCVCVPQCEGRECGGDGCNGSCAPGCDGDQQCNYQTGRCEGGDDSGGGTSGGGTTGGGDGTTGDGSGGGSTSSGGGTGGTTGGGSGATMGGGGTTGGDGGGTTG